MIRYILKRLVQSVVVILLVVCVVFMLLRLMPSDYFFTEDELMKFTETQKYAKLERLGIMELCSACHGSGAMEDGTPCKTCTEEGGAVKGTGYVNRSVLAQLGDFFGDMLQMRVFNAKGKEVKSIESISLIPYLSQRMNGEEPFGELKDGYIVKLCFNLGKSIRLEKNQYVTDVIAAKMSVSMEIGLISLLQTVLQYVCLYIGLAGTTAMKGAIIKSTDVFFIMLIASLLFRQERLTVKKIIACVIGFSGIVVMNLNGLTLDVNLKGDGVVLLG